jgi:nucleotide-binding universal stress UspA family protein
MENRKLMVVVDESPATTKALEYVAQIVAGRPNFRISLAHALLGPPEELGELRGAEKVRLQAYKSQWIESEEMTEQRALQSANAVLRRGGVDSGAVEAHFCYLVDGTRMVQEVLTFAGIGKCDTLVIGRTSHSWLAELINGDPAEEFVRKGKGLTIWIVE